MGEFRALPGHQETVSLDANGVSGRSVAEVKSERSGVKPNGQTGGSPAANAPDATLSAGLWYGQNRQQPRTRAAKALAESIRPYRRRRRRHRLCIPAPAPAGEVAPTPRHRHRSGPTPDPIRPHSLRIPLGGVSAAGRS